MGTGTVETGNKAAIALLQSPRGKELLIPFLPKGVEVERVIAGCKLALANNPALGKCTPESILLGVARIQSWGLEVGVTAHLVPFGPTATAIADYKGLCELAVASGAIRHIEAREVRDGDHFVYEFGLNAKLEHRPNSGKAGKFTHVYVILTLPGQQRVFDVMTADEVDAIRQQYSKQWKAGPLPYWYLRKTLIRRMMKTIPKNERLAKLFAVMAEGDAAETEAAIALNGGADHAQLAPGELAMGNEWQDDSDLAND